MNNKQIFNYNVEVYDKARPQYPQELFKDILLYSAIGSQSKVLEIGIGTGQATKPFLNMGSIVTAIDIGDKLIDYVAEKYHSFNNFHAICDDFVKYDFNHSRFDLIICATAFHWLPKDLAYKKIMALLRPGGTAALFWNHPFPNRTTDVSNLVNQKVYEKYRPESKPPIEFSEADCSQRCEELVKYGFFDVQTKLYHRVRTLTSDEYISLIKTYSDHRKLPVNRQVEFENAMKEELDKIGGKINIYDTLDLYLGRR